MESTKSAFDANLLLAATQLSATELAYFLRLSSSAFERRRRDDTFSRAHRARMVRIAHVLERAQRVLGNRDRGAQWLKHPNRALHFSSPLTLLETREGTQRVFAVLARIEGGVLPSLA